MPDNPDDRREYTRAPIELKVEYKKMNTFFADYTKNISKGGTFIKTSKPLNIGTEFVFKLSVPALSQPIEIRGQVMWINPKDDPSNKEHPDAGMGIKFLYATDQERDGFESLVERLMTESLGLHLVNKLVRK